jgi:hypothetical protein
MKNRLAAFLSIITLTIPGVLMPMGCGGGSGGSGSGTTNNASRSTGQIAVRLDWGTTSRQVPISARSVLLNITRLDGTLVQSRLFVRPESGTTTSTETFELPEGVLKVRAEAFATHDATGTAVAHFQTNATVRGGMSEQLEVALGSTIANVAIKPDNIPFTGAPVTVNAVATDSQGKTVLAEQWDWSNSNPSVIHMTADGANAVLLAVGPGTTTITVTERESGKSFQRTFTVAPL